MKRLVMKALYSMLLFENNLLVYLAEAVAFYLIMANYPLADGLVCATGFLVLFLWRCIMYIVYDAVFGYMLARENVAETEQKSTVY